jgi:hypothetical protein
MLSTKHLPQDHQQSSIAQSIDGEVRATPRIKIQFPLPVLEVSEGSFLISKRGFSSGTPTFSRQRSDERSDFSLGVL